MQHLGMEWNPPKFKVLGICFTSDLDNCEKNNYSERFAEVKGLLRIWMKRLITPLGRVAVLKYLFLSKLIHLWILLPNPPDEYINSFKKNCAMNLYGIKSRTRLIERQFIKAYKKALVFRI